MDERNCLPALRAHLRDLGEAPERLNEARLLILGNGRVGKTQIRRRLCGEGFDEEIPSTHGIVVTSLPVPDRPEARFHLWDFGGQDLYYGTHALFIRHRAAAMIVWEPNFEDSAEHEHGGQRFRNHPLPYWLKQVETLAGAGTPLLIVQSQCDEWGDERDLPAEARLAAAPFLRKKILHCSAAANQGFPELEAALGRAFDAIDKPLIGRGRAAVKREIERRIAEDAARSPEERGHRLMSREEFGRLCEEEGGISDPAEFLKFLDAAGAVIARKDLFGGRILLDQNWMLEAIYALFERGKVHRILLRAAGRFTRQDLGDLLWDEQGHSPEDQALFVEMMQACGISFRYMGWGEEAIHIAPDLLPEAEPQPVQLLWAERAAGAELLAAYPIPADFLMRGLICEIGRGAGPQGEYWRSGLHLYDERRKSRARADLLRPEGDGIASQIRLQAEGPQAEELLVWLAERLTEVEERHGLKREREERRVSPFREERDLVAPQAARDPEFWPQIFVSYAWKERDGAGPGREARVDEFCELARARGYEVIRDKEVVHYNASIQAFMERIAKGARVVAFFSDAYLRSAFCMSELRGLWVESRQNAEEFLGRLRVWFVQEDPTAIRDPCDRAKLASYWEDQRRRLHGQARKDENGDARLGEDRQRYEDMEHFANLAHEVLPLIMNRGKPQRLEDLLHPEDMQAPRRQEDRS